MRAGRILLIVVCGLSLAAACTQPKRLPPPSTDVDEDKFRDQVRTLASDEFAGRKPGTAGEEKTVAYLAAQFRQLKLKPGNGDSYLQTVPMVELAPNPDPSLSISGRGPARSLAYGRDMVIWTRRAVPQVALQSSDIVFVGYGIVAPEYGWNDYAGVDVRGKTVVALVGDPGRTTSDPKVFTGRTMTYYGRCAYKLEEAARHGASGVLLIHDEQAAGYGWDAVVSRWSGPQSDRVTADDNAGLAAVEGWLSGGATRAIFAQAGLEYAALTAAASRPGFKAVPFGLRADAEVRDSIRRYSSSNVIALLSGRQHHDEYVVYTAHWDHLGRTSTPHGESIYHGAVDNASGVAGLLQLAQSFSRTRPGPSRSIVFMAVTGGESGLSGSDYYVDNPIFPLQDTVADINLDALHIGGPTRDVTVFGFGQSELEGYLRDAAALQGRELHADPNPERGEYYRSDNFSFAKHGVPALFAVGGVDDAAHGPVWGQSQLDDYYGHRYHQPSDEYSPDWDVRGTLDDLRLYYRVGMQLAQAGRFPNWYHNSEFRIPRNHDRSS